MLAGSQTQLSAREVDISSGETQTSNGLAISPKMAALCADDYMRTITFIRGMDAAILDVQNRFPGRPVRVLYAGCGPYATLAVPLMVIFPATEVTFTLLDVHPESIESARSIVDSLGVAGSVTGFETMDAAAYQASADQPPDIILMEIMRACLETEPQVAVTRHLLKQAPHAILVPEEVRVDLVLMDPSCEFDLADTELNQTPVERDRISVATVFVMNRETVKSWDKIDGNRLPAAVVQIPEPLEPRYQPMLFTTVRTYQNHLLKDYDSGLICPMQLPGTPWYWRDPSRG
jgi:hypothetical protein